MLDNNYKVFLILEVLKGNLKRPIKTFVEKSQKSGITYFKYSIEKEKGNFELREIAELNKYEMIPKDIFITNSYNVFYKQNETIQQTKLKWDKFYKESIYKENSELIKDLFEGRWINEQ